MSKIKRMTLPNGDIVNISDYRIGAITGAQTGQIIKISTVDDSGAPLTLAVENLPTYTLSCENGVLILEDANGGTSSVSFTSLGSGSASLMTVSDDSSGNVTIAFHNTSE